MSKYAALVEELSKPRTVTPLERMQAAAAAVQTSLFNRLRKPLGGRAAGQTAWMLIRAGQGDHDDSQGALDALAALPSDTLRKLYRAAVGACEAMKNPVAVVLAGDIVRAVELELTVRAAKAGEIARGESAGDPDRALASGAAGS